jgi:hypothetical protein
MRVREGQNRLSGKEAQENGRRKVNNLPSRDKDTLAHSLRGVERRDAEGVEVANLLGCDFGRKVEEGRGGSVECLEKLRRGKGQHEGKWGVEEGGGRTHRRQVSV